jgi:CarD family transcriptional regulator
VKSAQMKAAAAEKIVSRKVSASATTREKDKGTAVRAVAKKKVTKAEEAATAAKVQAAAKSQGNKAASAAASARTSGKNAPGKTAAPAVAASRAKKMPITASPRQGEVKTDQTLTATAEKNAPERIMTPPPSSSDTSVKTSSAAMAHGKPSAAVAGSFAPMRSATPASSSSVSRPPETSERIQVTEKKNMRAASLSPATTAKAAATAQAAGASLAAAPRIPRDKSAAARASSAAVARAAAASPTELAAAASKPAAAKPASESKAVASKSGAHRTSFKTLEFIVYPAHGVGQIIAIEEQEVAGFKLELFVINFVKDKMTLKVPLPKVLSGAIRKLAEPETAKKSLDTLTGRARIKRTMWSRRAQEYEAKINSGDLIAIAEVVRDLYRSDAQPEQSYSERQLYEAALDRMAREIAAVQRLTEIEALKLIDAHLQRGPRRGARGDATADEPAAEEGQIEEAA